MSVLGWTVVGATDVAVILLMFVAVKLRSRRRTLLFATLGIAIAGNVLGEVVLADGGASVVDTLLWQCSLLGPAVVIFGRALAQGDGGSTNGRSNGRGW